MLMILRFSQNYYKKTKSILTESYGIKKNEKKTSRTVLDKNCYSKSILKLITGTIFSFEISFTQKTKNKKMYA